MEIAYRMQVMGKKKKERMGGREEESYEEGEREE